MITDVPVWKLDRGVGQRGGGGDQGYHTVRVVPVKSRVVSLVVTQSVSHLSYVDHESEPPQCFYFVNHRCT